jgi:cell division protein FtsL
VASTNHIVDEYLERASQPDVPLSPPSLPKSTRPAQYISQSPIEIGEERSSLPPTLQNRSVKKRKISGSTRMVLLVGAAVVSVLYVSNIIAIGQLLNEINQLRQREERLLTEQEILRARVNKMAGSERIRAIAEEQLGLKIPTEQPVWISIDPERVDAVEKQLVEIRAARQAQRVQEPPAATEKKSE